MRTATAVLAATALGLATAPAQPPPAPKFPPVLPAGARSCATLGGPGGPAWAVAAAGDGGTLLAAGENGALSCWNRDAALGIRGGDIPSSVLAGHHGAILALAAGGNMVVSGGADGKLIL